METTNLSKTHYPNLKQSIFLILRIYLVSFLVIIPISILMMILEKDGEPQYPNINSLLYLIVYVIPFIIIVRFAIRRMRHLDSPGYRLRFIAIPPLMMAIIIIMTLAFIIVAEPFSSFIPMPDFFKKLLEEIIRPDVFSFLNVVIAAPILEEIFFRGIILEGLLKNYSPKKAIIFSALIFGLVHLNPWQAITGIFAGLLIGWIYWRTSSIVPGILIHFVNNLISFSIMFFPNIKDDSLIRIIHNNYLYLALFVCAVILLFGCYKIINGHYKIPIKY